MNFLPQPVTSAPGYKKGSGRPVGTNTVTVSPRSRDRGAILGAGCSGWWWVCQEVVLDGSLHTCFSAARPSPLGGGLPRRAQSRQSPTVTNPGGDQPCLGLSIMLSRFPPTILLVYANTFCTTHIASVVYRRRVPLREGPAGLLVWG